MSISHRPYEFHGKYGTPSYRSYREMLRRCYNNKRINYERYGGRGIGVCKEWLNSFVAFYRDMGDRPEGMQLERKRNDEDYSKENCCWATPREQASNRRSSVFLTIGGVTKTMREWCTELDLNYGMVRWRKVVARLPDDECLRPTTKKRLILRYDGKDYTPHEIAKLAGIRPACVYLRIKKGWPVEEIINRPNSQPYKKPGWKFTPLSTASVYPPNHVPP